MADFDVLPGLDRADFWPATPPTRVNPRVLGPIFGAYHAARHRLDSAAREHGLDATECLVLEAIRRDPGCAPWAIRRRLGFSRSTLTSILDRLERDEMITRHARDPGEKRFELRLTPRGVGASDLAAYVLAALEEEIATYTSPAERRGAVGVFDACMALDRADRPHP